MVHEKTLAKKAHIQETQGINREESGNQGRARENQLNRITPAADQGRIHVCNDCGALYSGKSDLENHQLMTHSKAGPSPQSRAAVAAEVLAVLDAADAEDEEEEVVTLEEDTVEELPTVENTCVEVKEAIL